MGRQCRAIRPSGEQMNGHVFSDWIGLTQTLQDGRSWRISRFGTAGRVEKKHREYPPHGVMNC